MRLRARLAWWVYDRIADWLDVPEMTEKELDVALDREAAEQRAIVDALRDAEAEGYERGRRDAREMEW